MINGSNFFNFNGRLTADVKLEKTPNGNSIAKFSVGINRTKDITDFPRITAWRQDAEFLSKYAAKGDLVNIIGHVETRTYEDQTGAKKFAEDFVADKVQILSHSQRKSESNGNLYSESENNSQNAQNQSVWSDEPFTDTLGIEDSDLPF